MPDGVLCLRERIDDPDPESDGPDRSIEQPVDTGYPARLAAGPTSAPFIPGGLLPVPSRLDVRRFLRIFDVTHSNSSSVRDLAHGHTNHITFTAFRRSKAGTARRPRLGADRRLRAVDFLPRGHALRVLGVPYQERASHHGA